MTLVILINALCTWFMTGLIWFVQIVHYPLFAAVGVGRFQQYENMHCHLTSLVVVLPMIVEAISSLWLAIQWKRGDAALLWLNFALVAAIWICTAAFSIPSHERLCNVGFCEKTHQWLLNTNWVRTILWTLRSVILIYILAKILKPLQLENI